MSKKNRNSNAMRRERRVNYLVRLEIARLVEQAAILKRSAEINQKAIEMRVRRDLSANKKPKEKVDVRDCPRLLKAPHLEWCDADFYMRDGKYRVCEEDQQFEGDGLRLY